MIDWNAIKTEYLTSDTSYRKLAEKYQVNQATISKRAKNEEWVQLKVSKSKQLSEAALKNNENKQKKGFEQLNCVNERLIRLVDDKIKGFETLGKEEKVTIDVKDLRFLSVTINTLIDNVRNLKGIPTKAEEIAKERLEIEREKAKLGETSDTNFEIVVEKKEYAD